MATNPSTNTAARSHTGSDVVEVSCAVKEGHTSTVYEGSEVPVVAQLRRYNESTPESHKPLLTEKELGTYNYAWSAQYGSQSAQILIKDAGRPWEAMLQTAGIEPGTYTIQVIVSGAGVRADPLNRATTTVTVNPRPLRMGASVPVSLERTSPSSTSDTILSPIIRGSTTLLGFNKYAEFIDKIMCQGTSSLQPHERAEFNRVNARRGTPFPGIDAYQLLKTATEVYVMLNCGVLTDLKFAPEEVATFYRRQGGRPPGQDSLDVIWSRYLEAVNGKIAGGTKPHDVKTLPYLAVIRRRLKDVPITFNTSETDEGGVCEGIMEKKLTRPCFFELIWSYWHEEGMLVQTMNAIALRFQNQRASERDPLAQLDLNPLRPLSNLLWGYIQDEQHRLTVVRRAYEYDHHYGLTIEGKAVPPLRSADSRSKFLEAFHNLLHAALLFYDQDDDTTVKADGFSVLNGLKETHLLLSEGMHNQFGDLPSTARIEMLMQQWILAQPEMALFLSGRAMISYPEPWMDRVDAMKKLQGWTDVSVTYFNELAKYGEQILLSIRYGDWNTISEPDSAAGWARQWRPEIKQYVHAYRSVTGVDLSPGQADQRLSADRYTQPSVHLRNRLNTQQQRPADLAGVGPSRRIVASRPRNGYVSADRIN